MIVIGKMMEVMKRVIEMRLITVTNVDGVSGDDGDGEESGGEG